VIFNGSTVAGIFESPVAVFDSLFIKDSQENQSVFCLKSQTIAKTGGK
jgi:hypothetical protein